MRKILIALTAVAAVLGTVVPATATVPHSVTMSPRRALTNCSGTLGDWTILQHGNFGDLTDVDGDPQADVVIVGDSITTRGYQELATWLAGRGKTLAGSYWSGRPMQPAVDWALSLTTKPKILVFANETNQLFDPAAVSAQMDRLTAWAAEAPVTRLITVDTFAQRIATAACDLRNAGWINNQLKGEVCSWWNGFAQDPNRIGNYIQDGIHPYEGVGTNYWAAVVGNCIY
jgi:hypothetical protein